MARKSLSLFCAACLLAVTVPGMAASQYHPEVAAHRGASGYMPEHTLEAKSLAYAMGVDYIEQDVVMTRDKKLMVMHDVYLDTTTDVAKRFPDRKRKDGRYYACDFTADEIRSLRVSERFNPKTGKAIFPGRFPLNTTIEYRVPFLEEEFQQVQGLNKSTGHNIGVYVEVKEPNFFTKQGLPILEATIDMLTRYGYNTPDSRAILQIFDYDAVKKARELGWKGPLAMLVEADGQGQKDDAAVHGWLQTDEGLKELARYATIYAPDFALLAVPSQDGKSYTRSDLGDRARKAGMKLHTWTFRVDSMPKGFKTTKEVMDFCFKDLKLDGIFSDFPDVVVNYLKENHLR